MIWIIVVAVLLVGIGVLGWGTLNVIRKNEIMETFINNAYEEALTTLRTIRDLDQRQMFELDDDVGQIFQQLVRSIEGYAQFLGVEVPAEVTDVTQT